MGRRNHDEDDNKSENAEIRKSLVLSGSVAVFFMGVPYLVLGKDSVFVYHDQLDGEVIAYLLQAKHLWDGSGVLPEFMNGAAKTALTMPAPACVLLYRWLPRNGTGRMQVAGSFAGYLGMFCLLGWAGETSETLRRRKRTCRFHSHADRMYVCCICRFCRCTGCPSMDCRC